MKYWINTWINSPIGKSNVITSLEETYVYPIRDYDKLPESIENALVRAMEEDALIEDASLVYADESGIRAALVMREKGTELQLADAYIASQQDIPIFLSLVRFAFENESIGENKPYHILALWEGAREEVAAIFDKLLEGAEPVGEMITVKDFSLSGSSGNSFIRLNAILSALEANGEEGYELIEDAEANPVIRKNLTDRNEILYLYAIPNDVDAESFLVNAMLLREEEGFVPMEESPATYWLESEFYEEDITLSHLHEFLEKTGK